MLLIQKLLVRGVGVHVEAIVSSGVLVLGRPEYIRCVRALATRRALFRQARQCRQAHFTPPNGQAAATTM